jgi:hypothetical protein
MNGINVIKKSFKIEINRNIVTNQCQIKKYIIVIMF